MHNPVDVRSKWPGIAAACGVVLLFSSFTLVSRLGLASTMRLQDIVALRFLTAGLLMLPVLLFTWPRALMLRQAVLLALLGGIGFALLAYAGFWLAPAAHGGILLHGTLPLFSFLLASVLGKERVGKRRKAGLALIAAGIVIMVWESVAFASTSQLVGDAALLLASLAWSAYGLYVRKLSIMPLAAAAIVAVFSMAIFLPFYLLLSGPESLLSHRWSEILLQLVFQGVLIGTFSIFLYTKAVSLLGATETSLFTAAVPCLTTLAAVPLLGERISLWVAGGVAATTTGMLVSIMKAHDVR